MNDIFWHQHRVKKHQRLQLKQQRPCVIWFTGLSGSGKSTLANAVDAELALRGHHAFLLDGDNIRQGLNKDLGFSDQDRIENIRRIGEVSRLFVDAGLIVLSAFISPFRAERQMVRELLGADEFVEVFMETPLSVCEARDPKGLYQKARRGEIRHFTGIDSAYEPPQQAELRIDSSKLSVPESCQQVLRFLEATHRIRRSSP